MSRAHIAHLLALFLLAAAEGCSSARPAPEAGPTLRACAAPMTLHLRTRVYFDRSNTSDPHNPYSSAEWETFINEVLMRFLPAGGNLYDNTGWWRRPNDTMFRGIGRTMEVWAALPDSTTHRAAVDSVIAQLKGRYKHRVVFREEELVCEAAQ